MDELERDLRRVLRDDRWRLDADQEGTLDRVHRGAARRQRNARARTGGLSALAVVAVVAAGITVAPRLQQNGSSREAGAGGSASQRPAATVERTRPSTVASGGPGTPDNGRDTPAANPTGGPVPDGFQAASVTATSVATYYVLGTAPCSSGPCTSIVRTTDRGTTFRGIPAPKAALADTGPPSASTVSDLRFASPHDAYAYGGALWSTHDGGGSWQQQSLGGDVVRVEAAGGIAWAVVDTGSRFRLYRSPVGADTWTRVALPVRLDGGTPDLALSGTRVILIGGSGSRAVTLTSAAGKRFRDHTRPCAPELGGNLSASGGGLWMFCATGTQGSPYVSRDAGVSWRRVDTAPPGGWPNSAVIGARSSDFAGIAAGGRVYTISSGGGLNRDATPSTGGGASFRYVGFTTTSVGFAVRATARADSLWRTTDGGSTWKPVSFS